ncbi:MAG: hypothetical protein JSS86_12625 [Cyanobacteria bacterium SZAS LIN-2]|nr:hypothetical protein [Cyanobacteria bacterium SZAS LIN-2]
MQVLFNAHYWPMALFFAAFGAAFAFALTVMRDMSERDRYGDRTREKSSSSPVPFALKAAAWTFVIDLVLQRFGFYVFQPELTGSFFGFFWPLAWALVPAAVIGCICAQGSAKSVLTTVAAGALLVLWPTIQYTANAWGSGNAKLFASIPQVTTINDPKATIPPSDEQHIVRVTPAMASFSARQALSGRNNLSTRYAIGDMTLQAIKGHRYYAAPIVPTNFNDTFWTPAWGGRSESPGYVLIDAEHDKAPVEIHDEFHITLFSDGAFGMSLKRFAYQQGYDQGSLENAAFEVDDNFQPHWTLTYITPAIGNITGSKISKVLVIDVASAEPVLHAYNQGEAAIKWVDRVVSGDLVREYAKDWGLWGTDYALNNWFSVWMGWDKTGTMAPADGDEGLMLSYTKDEHNIWVVPMTSRNSTDHGVVGVLVFETDQNKATFYPHLNGFNHGGSVAQTMVGVSANGLQKYGIENLELYNIYGHLTWVAIYTKAQSTGSTFGAIGFMDAHAQEVSSVAYGTDLQTALSDYASKLASGNNGPSINQNSQVVELNGKIWRIAPNGTSSWRFQLVGDNKHYFDVNVQTYPGTPLLRDGDQVTGSYLDLNQPIAAIHSLNLVGKGAGETPATAEKK